MTQADMILRYMKRGYSLTALDALRLFQCFRLSARILDLKRQGHGITTTTVYDKRRDKHYASYSLTRARKAA